MARAGVFSENETVVALITGMGLKTAEALAGRVGPTMTIRPELEAFEEELEALGLGGPTPTTGGDE
jgi:threonine synthase